MLLASPLPLHGGQHGAHPHLDHAADVLRDEEVLPRLTDLPGGCNYTNEFDPELNQSTGPCSLSSNDPVSAPPPGAPANLAESTTD